MLFIQPALAGIAHLNDEKLVVDNTFTPMIVTPLNWGADIVVYSMTKFINGKNDLSCYPGNEIVEQGGQCGSKDGPQDWNPAVGPVTASFFF